MRPGPVIAALLLAACAAPSEDPPLGKAAQVYGEAVVAEGLAGDVWAFLYAPAEGPPGPPSMPRFATAISRARLQATDRRFVFGSVAPNPYRLWGLLDVNSNFDPSVDVLAQAGATDRVAVEGVELNVQPGSKLRTELTFGLPVENEPPGFRLEGDEADVVLDGSVGNARTLTLVSDAAGHLDPKRTAFHFGLVDTNSDGAPDDLDGDGVPELSSQIFLRWLPRPGEDRGEGFVIVPLAFDPSPFLTTLGGRLGVEVAVTRISGTVVPLAQRLKVRPGQLPSITPVGGAPRGQYELIALSSTGQFWRLPNALAAEQPAQGTRFHFDRGGP